MPLRVILAMALLGLAMTAAWLPPTDSPRLATSPTGQVAWTTFLFALPILLAASTLAGIRWASMLTVMYGTIGLALDLSTLIQLRGDSTGPVFLLSGISGLLNGLVIVLGGVLFLNVRDPEEALNERRLS